MRKVLVSLLTVIVAAGLVAPASGQPHVRHDEEAFADWFVPTGEKNEFKWLAAYVYRNSSVGSDGDWFSFAGFVKGRCIREKTRRSISIECVGNNFIHGDPEKDFDMSPLATDAQLRVRHKGRTHVVRWSVPPGGFGTYFAAEWCFTIEEGEEEEGEGRGGGIWNPAEADGHFFGHRFRDPTQVRYAALVTGVMVTTCSFRSVDYDPDTGSLHVSYRIPR